MAHLTTTPAASRRNRRRWVLEVAAIVAVLTLLGLGVLWSRRGAQEASLDEAARRFQQGPSATVPEMRLLTPTPGVYRYRGSGTEQLSVLQTQQSWGPQLPATITEPSSAGCWTFRIDYSTNHWEARTYCADDGVLREAGGTVWQRFDFVAVKVDETIEFACDPPNDTVRLAAAPGDTWAQSCVGRSSARGTTVTSAGSTMFVGREDTTAGEATVPSLHYRANRTLTGDQQGVETSEYWFSAETGQIIRFQREVRVDSPSPIGSVTYTESGAYQLDDPIPV
ncbi:MAG: hypothetical protein HYX32_13270 [Actinobacteria bacterium]|nr:hypothetical protein [Actinomycetota bacterium]